MKQLIMSLVFGSLTLGVNARSVNNDNPVLVPVKEAPDVDMKGNDLVFAGIEENADVYVVGMDGRLQWAAVLTPVKNSLDVSVLPAGTHAVAVCYGSRIKLTGYCSEVYITAPKPAKKAATASAHKAHPKTHSAK